MAKRGNNEWNFQQRKDGRWMGQRMDGFKIDGKRNRLTVYGETRTKAVEKANSIDTAKKRGEYVTPSKILVGQWLDDWFRVYGCPRWKQGTATTHLDNINLYLKPVFGKHPLQKLATVHIQEFINHLIDGQKKPSYIHKILEPLENALRQAVDCGYIIKNPADKAKKPPLIQGDITFFTINEQRMLLPHLPATTAGRALRFILHTGLRISELCGLQWGDIDGDTLHVQRSARYMRKVVNGIQEEHQSLHIDTPKTAVGRRIIPLNATALALLEEQRKEQAAQRLLLGSAWKGETPLSKECFIFASEVGTALNAPNVARVLRTSLKAAGLESCGVHALRHTFATNCIRAGVDVRTLAEIIGHTKLAFTLQMYVHSDIDTKRDAARRLESLL